MRIGIQTAGSHGDVRPFLALAGGLRSAKHEVTLYYTNIDSHCPEIGLNPSLIHFLCEKKPKNGAN